MDAAQAAIRDLEAMEAQQGAVCEAAPTEHPTCPCGSNRRQCAWSLASGQQSGFAVGTSDCLLRFARSSAIAGCALAQPNLTGLCGPPRAGGWGGGGGAT